MNHFYSTRRQMAAKLGTGASTIFGFIVETSAASETWGLSVTPSGSGILIDWGDGSTNTYTTWQTATHVYADAGTHQVTLYGEMSTFSCYTGGYNLNVVECLGMGSDVTGITSMQYSMRQTLVTYAPCPDSNLNMTSTYYFCPNIINGEIGAGVTVAGATFQSSGIVNLVNRSTALENASACCRQCFNLSAIPSFDGLDGVLTNVAQMFYYCTAATGNSYPFWDWTTPPTTKSLCYNSSTNLTDYATIPSAYK